MGERRSGSWHRIGVLRSTIANLLAGLEGPRLRSFFEQHDLEILRLFRYFFHLIITQRLAEQGESRDLSAKMFTIGPRRGGGSYFQGAIDRAQIKPAGCDAISLAEQMKFTSIERGRYKMPFARKYWGNGREAVLFARPQEQLVSVRSQKARILS